MPLAPHVELPERYRVTRHIASGGMASVWEVEDLLLGRIVAVKVLGAHFAADPRARARFQREARTAAQVSDHPHIATIYDIGDHVSDAFIVMEYFAGGTVGDRLRTARDSDQRVPPKTALRWLREAAAGLDVAHVAGIVHRDVKPANLLLDAQDRLAVGDFGIARLADDTHMTQTGQVLGTAAYLSPEQALGQPATAASDRYALAVVAYELLTGRRPFDGGPPAAHLRQHAETPPPRASQTAPELPVAVDQVLIRGLAKDPGDRPGTATAFVDDVERALTSRERTVDRTIPLAPLAPLPRREPQPPPREPQPPPREPERPLQRRGPEAPGQREPEPAPAREPPPALQREPEAAPPSPLRRGPRPAAAPEPASAAGRPRRMSVIPLLAIVAVLAGGVLAVALTSSGPDTQRTAGQRSEDSQRGGDTPATTKPARTAPRTSTPAPATPQPAQQPTTTTPAKAASATQSSDPATLNAKGDALNDAGRYGEAISPLQASVEGYREVGKTSDINYAYALYNLGVALNRSGNHAAAVEILRERAKIKDQPETVQAELDDALGRLGGGGEKKPGKSQGVSPGNGNGDGDDGYRPG